MTIKFDNNLLRRSTPPELASHLLALVEEYPEHQISTHLFNMAEQEAFSPMVLSIWLYIAASPETLLEGLKQDFSVSIRLAAIKRLAKTWQTKRWRRVWLAIGGTSGLISLLAQFSVAEIKAFLRYMNCTKGPDTEERGKLMSELRHGLFPSAYSNAVQNTTEQRTEPLIQRSSIPGYSKSMLVSLDLLRQLIAQTDTEEGKKSSVLESTVEPLVKRAWNRRRRIGWEKLEELFILCFRFLDAFPEEAKHLNFNRKRFLYHVVLFWAFSPSGRPSFNHGIISVFQKIPYHEHGFWVNILPVISWVRRSRRYDLLRLIFFHYGKRHIDIDNNEDLKGFGIGKWPQELFCELDQDSALQLLRRLLRTKRDDFLGRLPRSWGYSILDVDSDYGDVSILLGVVGDPEGEQQDF
jgi:hypothetical protein